MKRTLGQLTTLAASIVFWWWWFGSAKFAIGVLIMLAVHEMGHYWGCKFKGLKVSLPAFTPFGAAVTCPKASSASEEAFVMIAGPLLGTTISTIVLMLGLSLDIPPLIELARYSFMFNLFNMIPLSPLDGGGISMAIYRYLWVPGLFVLPIMIYAVGLNIFNLLLLALIMFCFYRNWLCRKMLPESYFAVSPAARIGFALAYLLLTGFLLWAFNQSSYGLTAALINLGMPG